MGPIAPAVIVTAIFTLKSDTTPVKIKVNKPRGTLYWGGAGLDGPYVQPQIAAFLKSGIKNCFVGLNNSASKDIGSEIGTLVDALTAGTTIRYEHDDNWAVSGMDNQSPYFNLIGYSYGSLLAAQTANYYSKNGHTINNLVLIGSPIDIDFLNSLMSNRNIKKVIVINLKEYGDPIYAGISQIELIKSAPLLSEQMGNNRAEGHFYYAHVVPDSPKRWESLANRLYNEGLR